MKTQFVRLLNDAGVEYPSYVDLWTCIRAARFSIVDQNAVPLEPDTVTVMTIRNGQAMAIANLPRPVTSRLVLWQLERPDNDTLDGFLPDCFDEHWISCPLLFHALNHREKHHPIRYVPIGACPSLVPDRYKPKLWRPPPKYDFACFSYLYGERNHRVNQIIDKGYTVAPNAHGVERDELLARCRWGLCLSQDRQNICEPLRYALFRQWGLPIVGDKNSPLDIYPTNNSVERLLTSDRRTFESTFNYNSTDARPFAYYIERVVY